MSKVFISHSSSDRSYVERLKVQLQRSNIYTLGDVTEQTSGEKLAEVIRRQIRESDIVVVIIGPQGVDKQWVLMELGAAWAIGKKVVIIVLPGVEVDKLDFLEPDQTLDVSRMTLEDTVHSIINEVVS